MTREQVIEKEKALLLARHNKVAKVKLKVADIDIPDEIVEILHSTTRKSDLQKVKLNSYREKTIETLLEKSNQLYTERLQKAKRTREANMEKDTRYVRHMGIWVNTTLPSSKLTRKAYAVINNRNTVTPLYIAQQILSKGQNPTIFIDETDGSVRYTEEYCLKYQQLCLQNFDINMKRFQQLDHQDFDKTLMKFVKRRQFQEVHSLEESICTAASWDEDARLAGFVYIMVLDEYKQVYIGITEQTVQKRIQQHWKKKKEFDRLIWGSVENSVLSIDSFGPLDTTRLFVKPYYKEYKTPLEIYESKCITAYDKRYILNRL